MKEAEDRLMRYHDGDLSAEEAAAVEQELARSKEYQALLADFDTVGAVLRESAEARGAAASDIADRVMAAIEAEPGVRAAPSAPFAPSVQKKGRVIPLFPALGLGLAAAAAAALFLRAPAPPSEAPRGAPQIGSVAVAGPVSPSAEASGEAVAEEESAPGASIESVDFGGQNGTIFMVASGPQVTPVVWLVDESAQDTGKMAPL